MFYRHKLSKTLADAVEQSLEMSPTSQLALFEELAIARELCGDSLKIWEAARALPDASKDKTAVLVASEQMAKDALNFVRDMAESAGRLHANSKDKFSVHNLQGVVNQLVRIMHKVCGDENVAIAQEFERTVQKEVRLLEEAAKGTLVTPDMDAAEMNRTIPLVKQ